MTEGGSLQTVQQLRHLEHQLSLKQMQIQRLLNITQAINNNMSAEDLFAMYREFLRFEMGMSKVLLLIKEDDKWQLAVQFNLEATYQQAYLIPLLQKHHSLYTIKESDEVILHEFDIVIPVYHNDQAIAYALVTVSDKEDLYHKIQFIQNHHEYHCRSHRKQTVVQKPGRAGKDEQRKSNLPVKYKVCSSPNICPNRKYFEVSSIYRPHFNVGGDYFDCLTIDSNRYLICLADISGKGVSAALLMSNLQANLRQLTKQYKDLEQLVAQLNESIFTLTKGDRFLPSS